MPDPAGMAELSGVSPPHSLGWGQHSGLGERALFLVLAPAGTAGAALFHHGLAALVEDGLALATPGGEQRASLGPRGSRPACDPDQSLREAELPPTPQGCLSTAR